MAKRYAVGTLSSHLLSSPIEEEAVFRDIEKCAAYADMLASTGPPHETVWITVKDELALPGVTFSAASPKWKTMRRSERLMRLERAMASRHKMESMERTAEWAEDEAANHDRLAKRARDELAVLRADMSALAKSMEFGGVHACTICHKPMITNEAYQKDVVEEIRQRLLEIDDVPIVRPLSGFINSDDLKGELVLKMRMCTHWFHQTCAHRWLSRDAPETEGPATCPLCRRQQSQSLGHCGICGKTHSGVFLHSDGSTWVFLPVVGGDEDNNDDDLVTIPEYAFPVRRGHLVDAHEQRTSGTTLRCSQCNYATESSDDEDEHVIVIPRDGPLATLLHVDVEERNALPVDTSGDASRHPSTAPTTEVAQTDADPLGAVLPNSLEALAQMSP